MKKADSKYIILAFSGLALVGCSTTDKKPEVQIKMEEQRTLLDNHTPHIKAVEARVILQGFQGGLTNKEASALKDFATDYANSGRGDIVISYPQGTMMDGQTDSLLRDAQKRLFLEGVDFAKMTFAPYQSAPNGVNAIVLSFAKYTAEEVKCKPWSEIDAKLVAGNLTPERFGCAKNANLAQMLVDPSDLLGDAKPDQASADKAIKGIDKYRNGEIEKVSGSVSDSGGN